MSYKAEEGAINMRVQNKFKRVRSNYWDWEIFLVETTDDSIKIADIKYVKYYLHKSFSTNIIHSRDKTNGFLKRGSGWGEFLVGVEVETEKGDIYHSLYWLDLGFWNTSEDKKQYPGFFEKGPLSEAEIIEVMS
ncbi:MAG: pYEATS domain-containing protein [Promethearchaeota archaeon]